MCALSFGEMQNAIEFLKEWTELYFRNKDMMQKQLKRVIQNTDSVVLGYIDKKVQVLVMPNLDSLTDLYRHAIDDPLVVVTFNTRENLDGVIAQWQKLITYVHLQIYFVNPWVSENKWIIDPYVHSKIADEDALKQGLESLFMGVLALNKSDIEKHLKKN